MFWQRPAEGVADGRRIGAGGYGAVVDCGKKCLSVLNGSVEAGGAVRHEPTLRDDRLVAISSNADLRPPDDLAATGNPPYSIPPCSQSVMT
jgi:hypothetical protein